MPISRLKLASVGFSLTLIATSFAFSHYLDTLTINGKATTVSVRTIDGSAYVKLADVAHALDMSVLKKGDGQYELSKSGGANQINGLAGKVGDTVFDGKWRFKVLSVESVSTYNMISHAEPYGSDPTFSWDHATKVFQAKPGYTLVVVHCQVKNAVDAKRTLWTAISDSRVHTALTDDTGAAYPPAAYDFEGAPTQSPWMLPGSQISFPVIFCIPEATKYKDLIFTLRNNQTEDKGSDLRIALAG